MRDISFTIYPLAELVSPDAPIVYGIVQPGEPVEGGVPFVQSRDVGKDVQVYKLQRTAPEIAAAYRRSTIRAGDILFSLRGQIGQSSLAGEVLTGANIARGIARVRVRPPHNPEFVRYALQSPGLMKQIAQDANGSTFKELTIDALRNLPIPMPSAAEQCKIAQILRTWDDAIEKLEALRAVKERGGAAMSRRCFELCHPDQPQRPTDWRARLLGEIFIERDQPGQESERLLSITMNGGVIDRDDVGRRDTSKDDKSAYKLILPGDIGYNTMRMWQGVSGLSRLRGIVSPAYTIVTPRPDHIDPVYAAHLFKSRRMVFDFERYSQGLTSDTWNLKFPAFSRIKVFLPPLNTQTRQAEMFEAMQAELALLSRQIDVLTRQKRGLMQKLLTGEWRVNP